MPSMSETETSHVDHRRLAVDLYNATWTLLDRDDRHVVRPLVVDEATGEALDVRRIRVAANRDA